MAKTIAPLLPVTETRLRQFGDRLRVARLRRRLTAKQVAERAGMAPMTLRSLERGGPGVTIGAYLAVMQVLGIDKDLDLLGQADPLGRTLQDAQLQGRGAAKPSPVISSTGRRARSQTPPPQSASTEIDKGPELSDAAPGWAEQSGFANAEVLAGLIDPSTTEAKKPR